MLFLFADERNGQFWMYNTYFDLDIVYIRSGGDVADIKRMTSCQRQGEPLGAWTVRCAEESENYVPRSAYAATLELPVGWLSRVTPDGADVRSVSWE